MSALCLEGQWELTRQVSDRIKFTGFIVHSDGSVGTVLGTEEETEAGTHLEAMRQAC